MGSALMILAAHYGNRLLWDAGPDTLATLLIDEAQTVLENQVGRSLALDTIRHGRKRGKTIGLAAHNAADVDVDVRLVNGCSSMFLFRTEADEDVARVLRLAAIEDTAANRASLRDLRNGESIGCWPDGARDRFAWDRDWLPGLAELLDTTPTGRRALAVA